MNTITIQLNDKQFSDLVTLLDLAHSDLQSDMDKAVDDESAEETQSLLEAHESIHSALADRSYLWTSSHGDLQLDVAARHVHSIAVSGDNEPACRAAIEEDGYLRHQLENLYMGRAREHLTEAGIDGVDAKDDELVRIYILWMACHDINDERNMEG